MKSVVETEMVRVGKGQAMAVSVQLQKVPLLIIRTPRGYVGCGYFSPTTMRAVGDCAAIVKGVKNISQMLRAPITYVTPRARKLGLKKGMRVEAALKILLGEEE